MIAGSYLYLLGIMVEYIAFQKSILNIVGIVLRTIRKSV